jgi:hypothetical protein
MSRPFRVYMPCLLPNLSRFPTRSSGSVFRPGTTPSHDSPARHNPLVATLPTRPRPRPRPHNAVLHPDATPHRPVIAIPLLPLPPAPAARTRRPQTPRPAPRRAPSAPRRATHPFPTHALLRPAAPPTLQSVVPSQLPLALQTPRDGLVIWYAPDFRPPSPLHHRRSSVVYLQNMYRFLAS